MSPTLLKRQEGQTDELEQSATEVAKELIHGKGGVEYRRGMKKLFKTVPTLIKDVDPQYRAALEKELQNQD
ncbi:MAG: hypothetical protein AAFY17_07030 [Cyanobacteria bacterium J06642_11]